MDCNANIRDLQNAVNFIKMQKDLKSRGSTGIIFPLIVVLAILTGKHQSVDGLLALALAVYSIQRLLMMTRPLPVLVLGDVIFIVLLGSYAIAANLNLWHLIIWGIILLLFLISTVRQYLDARRKALLKPGSEVMAFIESTAKDLRKDEVPDSDHIIELDDYGWAYRIFLGECAAIFVSRDDLFTQSRDEEVITLDSAGEGAAVYIVSTQYTKWRKWRISAENYQRYLAWKGIPAG